MNIIKIIKKRWNAIKSLLNCDEYFLVTAYKDTNFEPWRGAIKYNYYNNTDRDLFYTIVSDHINTNLRSITGKFICIKSYKNNEHNISIIKGSEVIFNKGYVNVISNGNTVSYKMPIEEIFLHFKFISN